VQQVLSRYPHLALPENIRRSIRTRIKDGRGQGTGANYRPWLTVRDLSSKGYSTRLLGWKTDRVHHLFNRLQRAYYASLEWSPQVIDIREHYPLLPLELTLAIADECGIKHPTNRRTGYSKVMTTDFLVTVWDGSRFSEEARTVKYEQNLRNWRTIAEMEIERRYWEWHNRKWAVVTETKVSMQLSENVMFVHGHRQLTDRPALTPGTVESVAAALTRKVLQNYEPLRLIAANCDDLFHLPPGSTLAVAYHLIANRTWQIDMYSPIEPGERLVLRNARELERQMSKEEKVEKKEMSAA
jgi:hypothetical protein